MIISHLHRFIFIKTRKTAGTSIEIALSEHCGPDDVITPIHPEDEKIRQSLGYRGPQNYIRRFRDYGLRDWRRLLVDRRRPNFKNHLPGPRIRQMISREVWESYYKFCVERDPYEKVISGYYWTEAERKRRGEPSLSLSDFLASDRYLADYSCWHRYAEGTTLIVDRIIRYENLNNELAEVCRHLGLPCLTLPNAKGNHRKDRRPAHELLGPEGMQRVRKVFARECEVMAA